MNSVDILFIFALILSLFGVGCVQLNEIDTNEISSDEYVFLEHHLNTDGENLEGTYPFLYIDFPTYSFDRTTGVLAGMISFPINNSLKAVYGDGTSRSGHYGSGSGTRLSGIYSFPYENDGLRITSIEGNGTIHIKYRNSDLILKSGESWEDITTKIEIYPDLMCSIRLTETDTIINHGILKKSDIKS